MSDVSSRPYGQTPMHTEIIAPGDIVSICKGVTTIPEGDDLIDDDVVQLVSPYGGYIVGHYYKYNGSTKSWIDLGIRLTPDDIPHGRGNYTLEASSDGTKIYLDVSLVNDETIDKYPLDFAECVFRKDNKTETHVTSFTNLSTDGQEREVSLPMLVDDYKQQDFYIKLHFLDGYVVYDKLENEN